jgi:hypothetical protein
MNAEERRPEKDKKSFLQRSTPSLTVGVRLETAGFWRTPTVREGVDAPTA